MDNKIIKETNNINLFIKIKTGYLKNTVLDYFNSNKENIKDDIEQDIPIIISDINIRKSPPRDILKLRKNKLGYVSQFLRVVPRVPTIDVVIEPLLDIGCEKKIALKKAQEILERLNIPKNLWNLSPLTFSGGEQQRVNIARGFIHNYPYLLLDEPTASLDQNNKNVVLDLIEKAKQNGSAIIGIFHDEAARNKVATREVNLENL